MMKYRKRSSLIIIVVLFLLTKDIKADTTGDLLKTTFAACSSTLLGSIDQISPDETTACAANTGLVLGLLLSSIGTPWYPTTLAAAGIAATGIVSNATLAANSTYVCLNTQKDGHPVPYTDTQIKTLLKQSGITNPTIEDIVDKYTKLCIQSYTTGADGGKIHWVKANSCIKIGTQTFCGFNPASNEQIVCARVSGTCPCTPNIQSGNLNDPTYKKDSSGNTTYDTKGNPQIDNQADFLAHFAQHCRVVRTISEPPWPSDYTGIIDEVCNDWTGYAKNIPALSSPVVQCLQETARNIFEKPVNNTSNNSGFVYTADQRSFIDQLTGDANIVNSIINQLTNIIGSGNKIVTDNSELRNVEDIVYNINNHSIFGTKTGPLYKTVITSENGIQYIAPVSNDVNLSNIAILNQQISDLQRLSAEIQLQINDFNSTTQFHAAQTYFETLQGSFLVFGLMMIMIWMTMLGVKIIFGADPFTNGTIQVKEIMPLIINFTIIYYFAFGSAWKDYFFNMLFNISNGFGQMFLDVGTDDSDPISSGCTFGKNYYTVNSSTTKCSYTSSQYRSNNPFPILDNNGCNIIYGGTASSTRDSNGCPIISGGQQLFGCVKGPFITKPNYQSPYKPISYQIDNKGTTCFMRVKCICNSNSLGSCNVSPSIPDCSNPNTTNPNCHYHDPSTNTCTSQPSCDGVSCDATIQNDFFGNPHLAVCPAGTTMEPGYRVSELYHMGILSTQSLSDPHVASLAPDANGLITTAAYIWDSSNGLTNAPMKNSVKVQSGSTDLATLQTLDRQIKRLTTSTLETDRTNANFKRQYPIITKQYGSTKVYRDMSYIGLFDTMDCKVSSYFSLGLKNFANSIASIATSGVSNANAASNSSGGKAAQIGILIFAMIFGVGGLGLIIAVLLLLMGLLIIGIVGKIVQSYLASIIGMVILVYLSPIIIPMKLFESKSALGSTLGEVYKGWMESLKGFVIYPPLLFMTIAIAFKLCDYILYGGTYATLAQQNMFDSSGNIQSTCWANNLSDAPLLCLIMHLKDSVSTTTTLGSSLPTIDYSKLGDIIKYLLISLLKTLVMTYMIYVFVSKIEETLSEIFGIKIKEYTNVGPFDKVDGIAGQAAELAKTYAKSLSSKRKNSAGDGDSKGNTSEPRK